MSNETLVARIVADALEWREEHGTAPPLDELCAEHPELLPTVARALEIEANLAATQASSAPTLSSSGELIGVKYRLGERIGSGAMGLVHRARDLDLNRNVAIKIMRTDLLDEGEGLERFEREATALAALNHSSIVTIHDRGVTEDGRPFLVMELVEGVSCAELISYREQHHSSDDSTAWLRTDFGIEELEEPSFVRQAARWGAQIAEALAAAHGLGVIHRDVKPSNVIIARDGRAVLLDFGIAGLADSDRLTRTDGLVGTPAYLAPEALSSEKAVGPSADVYGLAATLYHLFTGRPPYEGDPRSILAAVATRDPRPAESVRPGLPKETQAILEHGMARRPQTRYSTPTAMRQDLVAFLQFQPLSVRPTTRLGRGLRRLRRSRLVLGLAVGVLLTAGLAYRFDAQERAREAAGEAFYEIYQHLPANLGVVGPANRFVELSEARAAIAGLLDDLVDTGHERVLALTLRGTFRIDQGDTEQGLSDLERASAEVGTAFSAFLAEQLRIADGALTSGAFADAPPWSTQDDVFLAFLHGIRSGTRDVFVEAAADPRLRQHLYGADLTLLMQAAQVATAAVRQQHERVFELGTLLLEDARELMRRRTHPSATLRHIEALALRRLNRFGDALAVCETALELSPYSHPLLNNAAECAYHEGRHSHAITLCRSARALVADEFKLLVIQSLATAGLGDLDASLVLLEQAPFETQRNGENRRRKTTIRVAASCAVARLEESAESAAEAARIVLQQFQEMPASNPWRSTVEPLFDSLADGDTTELFDVFAAALEAEPGSRSLFALTVLLMPTRLTEADAARVRPWFDAAAALRLPVDSVTFDR